MWFCPPPCPLFEIHIKALGILQVVGRFSSHVWHLNIGNRFLPRASKFFCCFVKGQLGHKANCLNVLWVGELLFMLKFSPF